MYLFLDFKEEKREGKKNRRKEEKKEIGETEKQREREGGEELETSGWEVAGCTNNESFDPRNAEKCSSSERARGFLNFVFAVATVHGCHYVSANSHVVVNHLWLLCIACKAKGSSCASSQALSRSAMAVCPVAAGYVCNFETKGEAKREREKGREAERADEQVPLDFNRFTTLAFPPPLFPANPLFCSFHASSFFRYAI